MTLIEAAKQALGALENAEAEGNCEYGATALLRTAIKTIEQHEPVAWITKWSCNGSRGTVLGYKKERHHGDVEHIPLYTTLPAAQESGPVSIKKVAEGHGINLPTEFVPKRDESKAAIRSLTDQCAALIQQRDESQKRV